MTHDKTPKRNRIRDALSRIYDGQPSYFREYLRRYKQDPKSRVFAPLAEAYRRMGKIEEAIEICVEGLKHHPEFTGGRVALAKCYFDLGKHQRAREELETIIDKVPENLLAQRLLGDVCLALEDPRGALHCYKMALLLAPNDSALAQKVKNLEEMDLDTPVVMGHPAEVAESKEEEQSDSDLSDKIAPNAAEVELPPAADFDLPKEELIPVVSDGGKVEMVPFTDDQSLSNVERILGLGTVEEDEPFRVEHVSGLFEQKRASAEITTETLGDLYYSQGQFDQSLRIFERINQHRSTPELTKKISDCRAKLGVGGENREKKIEMLQGILGKIHQTKTDTSLT